MLCPSPSPVSEAGRLHVLDLGHDCGGAGGGLLGRVPGGGRGGVVGGGRGALLTRQLGVDAALGRVGRVAGHGLLVARGHGRGRLQHLPGHQGIITSTHKYLLKMLIFHGRGRHVVLSFMRLKQGNFWISLNWRTAEHSVRFQFTATVRSTFLHN